MYSYDRRIIAGRVTFGRFGRLDADGGDPADVLLDGVRVGEISRQVDSRMVGVTQRVFNVTSYTATIQGPLGGLHGASAVDDKEFKSLPELKRALVELFSKVSDGVAEAYRLYWDRKITSEEWRKRVEALL